MSTTRRVPPPCWTHDETIALISSYRDKWLSLTLSRSGNRATLSASQWEAVATDVTSKSSTQCRHKMEKLRKRYRSEKQKYQHHYLVSSASSWVLFPLMDDMEKSNLDSQTSVPSPGSKLKNIVQADENNSDAVRDSGTGISIKTLSDRNSIYLALRAKNFPKFEGGSNGDRESYRNSRSGSGLESFVGQKSRTYGTVSDTSSSMHDFDENVSGFPVRTLGDRNLVPPGFKPKSSVQLDQKFSPKFNYKHKMDYSIDKGGGNFVNSRNRTKNSNVKFNDRNVFGKREVMDSVAVIVSAVKMLGEEFVKVERMKMEMVMEIEKMRMEMEMKRNEVILESHQLAVETFVNAMFDRKKKKAKLVSLDS